MGPSQQAAPSILAFAQDTAYLTLVLRRTHHIPRRSPRAAGTHNTVQTTIEEFTAITCQVPLLLFPENAKTILCFRHFWLYGVPTCAYIFESSCLADVSRLVTL